MSYYVEMTECKFFMSAAKVKRAWMAVTEAAVKEVTQKPRVRATLGEAVVVYVYPTPEDMFYSHGGFRVTRDAKGSITHLLYVGNKYTGRQEFLQEIAPYVKDGSRLEFLGEDGHRWALEFRKGTMVEVGLQPARNIHRAQS